MKRMYQIDETCAIIRCPQLQKRERARSHLIPKYEQKCPRMGHIQSPNTHVLSGSITCFKELYFLSTLLEFLSRNEIHPTFPPLMIKPCFSILQPWLQHDQLLLSIPLWSPALEAYHNFRKLK